MVLIWELGQKTDIYLKLQETQNSSSGLVQKADENIRWFLMIPMMDIKFEMTLAESELFEIQIGSEQQSFLNCESQISSQFFVESKYDGVYLRLNDPNRIGVVESLNE